jgi:pyruvate/2-oxoglutarate/acetoin dehydrogenase E1 component
MFGDFVSLCADQIINSACKFPWMYNHQVQVPLTIRTPMGGRRGYGPTHSQTIEPIFFNIPGLTIIAPSHFHNPGALLEAVVSHSTGPVLFIENKMLYPRQLEETDDKAMINDFHARAISSTDRLFPTISLCLEKDSSPNVTLVVYGGMAPLATEAAYNLFMREEILVEVLIPSIVKPIPIDDIGSSIAKSGRVVIAEEAVRYSGWGAELTAQIQEKVSNLYKPVVRIGAREFPIPCSRPLEDQILPQIDDIENQILSVMK